MIPMNETETKTFVHGNVVVTNNTMSARQVRLTINGREYTGAVEPRKLLTDFLRDDLGLTGTHVGCEHGVCGACTILFNGEPVRSCLLFAVQAHGADLKTVEGIAPQRHRVGPAAREVLGAGTACSAAFARRESCSPRKHC